MDLNLNLKKNIDIISDCDLETTIENENVVKIASIVTKEDYDKIRKLLTQYDETLQKKKKNKNNVNMIVKNINIEIIGYVDDI